MADDATPGWRTISVRPEPSGFGARIAGVDLSRPLDGDQLAEVKAAFARHQVVWFEDQPLTLDQLEGFTRQMGPIATDPLVQPVPGHPHVLEVRREPDEPVKPFGANWHSDSSYLEVPPAATLLRAHIVPPVGGDTLFCDCAAAYDALPEASKEVLAELRAIHTSSVGYGPRSDFAREAAVRSMKILTGPEAETTCVHPLVRTHPVTGRKSLYASPVHTWGIEGMRNPAGRQVLEQLFAFMTQPQFVYRHVWQPGMLVMWDNRTTLHMALDGYAGHRRVMHRTTIAGERPV